MGTNEHRVVAISGGASGIGLAAAQHLAHGGWKVVVGDIDAGAAEAAAASLGGGAEAATVDVRDEDQVAAFTGRGVDAFGRLDAVVHCAGVGSDLTRVGDTDVAEWRRVVDINLTGTMLVLKHASRVLQDGGSIVSIASLNARQPAGGMGSYAASKAGVAMLTKVAAIELGARGIRVNAVAPGLVRTPLTSALTETPAVREAYEANTPLVRHGEPEDIAGVVAFLVSPDAAWITGELLGVDGGAHTLRYPDLLGLFGVEG